MPDSPVGPPLFEHLAGAVRAVAAAGDAEPVPQVLEIAMRPFEAVGGLVLLLTEHGGLRLEAHAAVPDDVLERFLTLGIASGVPVTDAVRFGRPVWIETVADRDARYPMIGRQRAGSVSSASVPIVVRDQVVGSIGIALGHERRFAPEERAFLEAIADLCALSLEGSRTREATRYAEEKSRWAVATLADQFRLVGVERERVADEARRRQVGSIVDAMTDGVAVATAVDEPGADRKFVIEYANPAAAAVLGTDRAALMGSSVGDLFPGTPLLGALHSVFDGREPSQVIIVAAPRGRIDFTITRSDDGVVLLLREMG